MSALTVSETTARLARRLRMLADELESADRYGVPVPFGVYANGHEYGETSFSATAAEFDAWAEYTEAEVEAYEHEGQQWRRATTNVNGLPLTFATSEVSS